MTSSNDCRPQGNTNSQMFGKFCPVSGFSVVRSVAQTYIRPKLNHNFWFFEILGPIFWPPDLSSWENIQFFMESSNPTSKILEFLTQGPKIGLGKSLKSRKTLVFCFCFARLPYTTFRFSSFFTSNCQNWAFSIGKSNSWRPTVYFPSWKGLESWIWVKTPETCFLNMFFF